MNAKTATVTAQIEQQIYRVHELREMRATYQILCERACVMIDQTPRTFGWRQTYGGKLAVVKEIKQRIQELEAEEQKILKSPVE